MGKGWKLCPEHIRILWNGYLHKLWIRWSSFDWRLEVLVLFLRFKSEWRDAIPLLPSQANYSKKLIYNRNFKRAILLSIVERSSIGDVNLPTVLSARITS